MAEPQLGVRYHDLGPEDSLASILGLAPPAFLTAASAFKQLNYIDDYLRRPDLPPDPDATTRSLVIERHYIDRDYIEDHSAFYSKNVFPYPNHCRRVHLFALSASKVKESFSQLAALKASPDKTAEFESYRAKLEQQYLGFTVIKPLQGTPVGRTVLRPLGFSGPDGKFKRAFDCARSYAVHLLGVELRIRGLAFQQQDVGVSACATTALWASLHKIQDHEHIGLATPAQITALASQFSLPFGRPMPSEGLSIDQMCQAVHALALAPDLIPVRSHAAIARAIIHAAVLSGFAPVLILSYPGNRAHAVCVVGEKLSPTPSRGNHELVKDSAGRSFAYDDDSDDLLGVYFHDDRFGPYLVGDIRGDGQSPHLSFEMTNDIGKRERDEPVITHILVPIHPKMRLSFLGLRDIAIRTMRDVLKNTQDVDPKTALAWFAAHPPRLRTWIQKGHEYLGSLVSGSGMSQAAEFIDSWASLRIPRYCGLVRVGIGDGSFDLVVDCTSTRKNPNFVATISSGDSVAEDVADALARRVGCPAIVTR